MTDHPETLARYRLPLSRDHLKQATAFAAPALRYVPKNPFLLIGAAVVGVAGVLAWRNRERISEFAKPLLADARTRGQALVDDAKTKGEAFVDEAKAKAEAVADTVAEKATRVRRAAAPDEPKTDLH